MPPKKAAAASRGDAAKPRGPPPAIRYYLVGYNLVSFFFWVVILTSLVKHLLLGPQTSSLVLHKVSLLMEPLRAQRKYAIKVYKHLPAPLARIVLNASTTHAHIGGLIAFTQNLAVLEIVHAALGWVRSPVPTTAIQVGSRLWAVWGVTERYDGAAVTPAYATMIFAWSVTEVIRYAFYAQQLMGYSPDLLLWLRYTTFYVLYPLGAGSEAACMYATLPSSFPWNDKTGAWGIREYIFAGLLGVWALGLYVMYTHMIKQRRRALGKAPIPPKGRKAN